MKFHLFLIALLCSSLFAFEDVPLKQAQSLGRDTTATMPQTQPINMLDSLAHNFMYKSDNARRQYVAGLSSNTRVFQLAYGLKRLKQYDLIRQYIHPNIQMLVLYGANSYYISVGRQFPSGLVDNLYGFPLTAMRYQDQDSRDSSSTYLTVHSPGWGNKRWKMIPTMSTYGGMSYYMTFTGEEFTGYDNVNQNGWSISAVRRLEGDKRTRDSTYLNVNKGPVQSNLFTLTPVRGGDCFLISLSRDDLRLDVDQTGWFMAVGEDRAMENDPEDIAKYVILGQASNYCWNVHFAM